MNSDGKIEYCSIKGEDYEIFKILSHDSSLKGLCVERKMNYSIQQFNCCDKIYKVASLLKVIKNA